MTHLTKRMLRDLEGTYTLRVMDMPEGSKGCVLFDADDHANIYINAHLSRDGQLEAADHELIHLINDDFHNSDDIRTVESRADANCSGEPCSPRPPVTSIPNLIRARDLLHAPSEDKPIAPPKRPAPILSPHQAAVIFRAVSDLDDFLFTDRYDY